MVVSKLRHEQFTTPEELCFLLWDAAPIALGVCCCCWRSVFILDSIYCSAVYSNMDFSTVLLSITWPCAAAEKQQQARHRVAPSSRSNHTQRETASRSPVGTSFLNFSSAKETITRPAPRACRRPAASTPYHARPWPGGRMDETAIGFGQYNPGLCGNRCEEG